MQERLEYWSDTYNLKDLKIVGYRGGYPIIEFKKQCGMKILNMTNREIDKIVRNSETYGGIELGVAYNFRKTAFVILNDETIVICGHEFVIDRILKKII